MIKDVGKQGKSRRAKIAAIIVRAPGLPFFVIRFSASFLPWRFTVRYQKRDIFVKIFTFVLQDKGNRE